MDVERIEDLYWGRKRAGGQAAQEAAPVSAAAVVSGFAETAAAVEAIKGAGPFYPSGQRKPLSDLLAARAAIGDRISDTAHLQALLWARPRWRVEDHPELDFHFLAREISPGRAVVKGRPSWMLGEQFRLSADALLINAVDRTPIVAEFKVGNDQNAEYALVQALAAAAQLSSVAQRRRLAGEYRDALGDKVPERLDVYVVLAERPTAGTGPRLLQRALRLAAELSRGGSLEAWVRRIEIFEATGSPQESIGFRRLSASAG